ncbi:tRNA glutamyl-Q(34) synthetase GluQRS [Methylotenera mobilis]|uniref:Glutamyl-Q tRNA(Asp) synthetase n=1 Tax=Methylotenera mobilis (strain JLW8 / ATCC BAA-1282 / DSM 17540) TaxID=583345 RepID=C6WWV3_METML|nr:tRNA glutamyl-Q(34) synthetase GluQRS [Methylotenera mobilis]ACT48402.1 Glutamate--tRNA ligase [Methylotenera mobilis JLW8]
MYIGRFAPSPTGPMHFGSLVAAVASFCEARVNQGRWLVRMEDLDKPREIQGAADTILKQLAAFGFEWDDTVVYQSQRSELYADALNQLNNKQLIYPCTCTRKEIADSSTAFGIDGRIYPQTCLHKATKPNTAIAWRIKTHDATISFHDKIQHGVQQHIGLDVGDFILKRADGLFAYQLAVVVDDAAQGITHIVRGADLLNSTPRQIYLQQELGFPTPQYAHVPVAANANHEKLSKQTLAKPIEIGTASQLLYDALCFLGQQPPASISTAPLNTIWQWALAYWSILAVPQTKQIIIAS